MYITIPPSVSINGEQSVTSTRARFEELNMALFRKIMIPVQQVLKDSQVSKHEVDEMVIFGGST